MRLARFRRLAWVLALVLLAGLAAPAFASLPGVEGRAVLVAGTHVHGDGAVHVHAKPLARASDQALDPVAAAPMKAPYHCPGCLSAAECAISCLGVGLLPASIAVPASPARMAWAAVAALSLVGASPAGDLDPPRPVPVR